MNETRCLNTVLKHQVGSLASSLAIIRWVVAVLVAVRLEACPRALRNVFHEQTAPVVDVAVQVAPVAAWKRRDAPRCLVGLRIYQFDQSAGEVEDLAVEADTGVGTVIVGEALSIFNVIGARDAFAGSAVARYSAMDQSVSVDLSHDSQ